MQKATRLCNPSYMSKFTFTPGERVAGMYSNPSVGTVLDYSGIVEAVRPGKTAQYMTIRYASGEVRETIAHPDFVFTMEPAYRLAARFLEDAPGVEPSGESFEAVSASWPMPDFWDARRALWVLTYAREAIR